MTEATQHSDEEIIRALQADEPCIVNELVSEYWPRLVRYADGILGEGGAEDVVQDTFVRLWNRRKELRANGSIRALLFTLTRNAAIDERRRRGRREAKAERFPGPSAPPSPLEYASASELATAVAAAIARLPARQREIFELVRIRGLSYREVAASLDVAPQTVANQMCTALATLRKALVRRGVIKPWRAHGRGANRKFPAPGRREPGIDGALASA